MGDRRRSRVRGSCERMDDDFGKAEQPNGEQGGADSSRGVPAHGMILPGAGLIDSGAAAMGYDGFAPWQADLASM